MRLRRTARTPIGWYAKGLEVTVLVDNGGTVIVCVDHGHHPGSFCHSVTLLARDVIA